MLSQSESSVPVESETRKRRRWMAWRSGMVIAVIGILPTLLLYAVIAHLQALGQSAAAIAMPDMHMKNMATFWSFPMLQASGLTGLFFAYFSIVLGLLQSGRTPSWFPLSYSQIDRFHRQLGLLIVGLVSVHVVATVLDAMGDSWRTVLIPGQWAYLGWPQAVLGYNLGIFAIYILALTAPTFYLRRMIRPDRWRFLHRFVLVFYLLSFWHALILGLDVGAYGWIRPVMWIAQLPLLALCIRRLLEPRQNQRHFSPLRQMFSRVIRYGLVGISAAGIVTILAIVLTGQSGFIPTV
jgi:predicted ferric reductase